MSVAVTVVPVVPRSLGYAGLAKQLHASNAKLFPFSFLMLVAAICTGCEQHRPFIVLAG